MNTTTFTERLADFIHENRDDWQGFRTARTYAEAGVITSDDGVVIRLEDGTEYQLTVVRSR